jgi:hypothetical protein
MAEARASARALFYKALFEEPSLTVGLLLVWISFHVYPNYNHKNER